MNVFAETGVNQRMEIKTSGTGSTWVQGTLRVKNKMKNRDGQYDSSFFTYKVLGKQAEVFATYQQEGKELHITGYLVQERWEQDGQKRDRVVLMVQDFDLPKREEHPTQPAFNSAPPIPDINEDELPF